MMGCFSFLACIQEKVEITKEQQALMKVIVDAYNRHQIPQDVAKKLVYYPQYHFKLFELLTLKDLQVHIITCLNLRRRYKLLNAVVVVENKFLFPAARPVQCRGKLSPTDGNGNKPSSSSGGVYKKYSRYSFLVCTS